MAAPPLLILILAAAILAAIPTSAFIHLDDLTVLSDLHGALTNPDALPWPKATDPCGTPGWVHVSCDRTGRVNNLDLKNAGLAGMLLPSFPRLAVLQDLSLQNNNLSGPLPSFRVMANLRRAYLNGNAFDALPADFFHGLRDLEEICLDDNPTLNKSSGDWAVPPGLAASAPQLRSLRLMNCSLVGPLPESLGNMSSRLLPHHGAAFSSAMACRGTAASGSFPLHLGLEPPLRC